MGKYAVRHWITLVEKQIVPQMERERIIAYMVDCVVNHRYWDENAKTKDGSPMATDDAYDMADTWEVEVGSDEFRQKVVEWAEARYDEVTEKLGRIELNHGLIPASRLIAVDPPWKPQDGLGIYWCFWPDSGDLEGTPWGDPDKPQLWLNGLIRPEDVDWFYTVLANMDWMSGDREHELRVKKGSPIKLIGWEFVDDEHGHHNNICCDWFRA